MLDIGSLVINHGNFVTIKKNEIGLCLHNISGTNMYVFESGNYDGFSASEENDYLNYLAMSGLRIYNVKSSLFVSEDYHDGLFDKYFKYAHIVLNKRTRIDEPINIMDI